MIDLEHVSKEYKRGGPLALDDINLHVDDGEFVFLLGHSGAGKSTLLKLLLREELPSEGKVTVLGKDVASLHRHQVPYLRRQMGIIFQDFRLIRLCHACDQRQEPGDQRPCGVHAGAGASGG